ncbi:RING/U-box superfamily protein [Striga asiatica]|uniref:RING-type E3 ubiquitin transferase n=1 Tax=Striga asiatica TaxID=4170 RepID=A0A5A7PCE2_STRAF|nr:RING/U-box superfamily protein [Striga asiatica]
MPNSSLSRALLYGTLSDYDPVFLDRCLVRHSHGGIWWPESCVLGLETDDSKPTSCKKHGPEIQFSFRIEGKARITVGIEVLKCFAMRKNETMLLLPSSVQVAVKHIDYATQQIHLYDPEN